jgi:hypothetical protein
MCCECTCGPRENPRFEARGWGRGHGPPPWAGRGGWWDYPFSGPTQAQRKETLEALKQDLEARLSEVNTELGKL